jgi:hypothetical protein
VNSKYEVIATVCWKPIIDQPMFDKVQRLLALNEKRHGARPKGKGYQFLMTQLLACRQCKALLTNGATQKAGDYTPYYNHRKGQQRQDCPLPRNIPADKLDTVIWERLAKEINIETELREALTKQQVESNDGSRQIEEDIEEILVPRTNSSDCPAVLVGLYLDFRYAPGYSQ